MPEVKKLKPKKKKKVKMLKKKPSAEPSKSNADIGVKVSETSADKGNEKGLEKSEAKEDGKEVVTLNYSALSKVLRHGMRFSSPNISRKEWVECMGFLIGDVNDGKLEIKDAIPMVHGSLVEVEFQDQHYAKADEINQTLTDENWIVGWYHTHPGHGLFLSAVDKINHSGYQSLNSKAVALVFDPSKLSGGSRPEEYMTLFRLKNPELREKSEFIEIKQVKIKHSFQEAVDSLFEASMLGSKNYPLILEYGEDYKRPEVMPGTSISEEADVMTEDIKELRELIGNIRREIRILHNELKRHMVSTGRAIEELKKGAKAKPIIRRKGVKVCGFCGYDSIMPGDKTCANCGMKL